MPIAILNELYDRRMERLRAKRLARAAMKEQQRINRRCDFLEYVLLAAFMMFVLEWLTGGFNG